MPTRLYLARVPGDLTPAIRWNFTVALAPAAGAAHASAINESPAASFILNAWPAQRPAADGSPGSTHTSGPTSSP
jgi:hypothetical protein